MGPGIEDLGRADYGTVLATMRALHARVCAGQSAGCMLLVEHDPVYTAGRATPAAELGPGIVAVERGGRVTFHGPGQLVVYPIVPLPRPDLRDWLRRLEAFGIAVCADFGLDAAASVDGTGVFVGGRKVASIGVAVRRWVNLHGIAINVAMDLAAWRRVRPCGLDPELMTDLRTAAGRDIDMAAVKASVRQRVFVLTDTTDPL
jgi:lipoate-protein ligase B